ncbi:MAG TPA: arylamine N-acetyltransferase [Steroidobacteraceae bacterium]
MRKLGAMREQFDLGSYLRRIGYAEQPVPTLETLRKIHERHPHAIAFENLNPLLRIPVRLDEASLVKKILHGRRGGYCYEHNLLLKRALEEIGFEVTGLAARVLLNRPEDAITPRTHMLLRVDLDEETWIADVGFGGMTLTAPLRLIEDEAQSTPHEPFRVVRFHSDYLLQTQVRTEWRTLYRFNLEEQHLPDYEVANWYLSNNPESHFVTGLIAARSSPGRRYALRNNELAVHELGGKTTRTRLTTAGELRECLERTFGLELPEVPELGRTLERIAASTPAEG